ncbi:hypothetical protein MKY19_02610 [Paenibacillus sp. FSL R5-0744]
MRPLNRCEGSTGATASGCERSIDERARRVLLLSGCDRSVSVTASRSNN